MTSLAPFAPLLERTRDPSGYTPGDDLDKIIAIAHNGGGMSTVHVVGMARVLEQEGIYNVADNLVGTSGGGTVAASALSGQLSETEEYFTNSLAERKFINLWRIFGGGKVPVINLPMLRSMITIENPLNTDRILASKTELGIGITNLTDFETVIVSSKQTDGHGLSKGLMRTVHMPWVAGPPEVEDGVSWGDGGLSWMSTSDVAKGLGANTIIELSNNPKDIWKEHNFTSGLVSLWIHKYGSALSAKKYREFTKAQVKAMNSDAFDDVTHIYPQVEIASLPSTLCHHKNMLKQGLAIGKETARAALGYESKMVPTYPEARKSLKRILGHVAASPRTIIPLG